MTRSNENAMKSRRVLALVLAFVFLLQSTPFAAEPEAPKDTPAETTAAATPHSNTTAAPVTATGVREPLIEVSVDSLEISESNTNVLGILWGTENQGGARQINFYRTLDSIPFERRTTRPRQDIRDAPGANQKQSSPRPR